MDETFQLRARRPIAPRVAAPLDYSVLSAALVTQQSTSPAALAQLRFDRVAAPAPEAEPLIETLLAGSGWRMAASAQQGCFNRAEVKRRRNGA